MKIYSIIIRLSFYENRNSIIKNVYDADEKRSTYNLKNVCSVEMEMDTNKKIYSLSNVTLNKFLKKEGLNKCSVIESTNICEIKRYYLKKEDETDIISEIVNEIEKYKELYERNLNQINQILRR